MRNSTTILILSFIVLSNCFSPKPYYVPAKKHYDTVENNFQNYEEQFSSGEPYFIIDKLGHFLFSLPAKLLLWNWSFANHEISEETKMIMKDYMKYNNLNDVKVRFNEYAPIDEFYRLYKNDKISPIAKYSLGMITWIIKTIFPERIFAGFGIFIVGGGDYYDPYTNTVHIYSNSVPIALHEGGHAKDFASKEYTTSYSLLRIVPFTALYQEAVASQDAIDYLRHKCLIEHEKLANRQLPPAYSTYLASSAGANVILFALPGHMVSLDLEESLDRTEIPECGNYFGK